MNMTIVLVSKRSFELLLVLVSCSALLSLLPGAAAGEAESLVSRLADESSELTGQEFSDIVHQFGAQLSGEMSSEMSQLVEAAEARARARPGGESSGRAEALERLRQANERTSEDVKTRIELVGDNGASLPQLSLGGKASSFLAQASDRLQSAGAYIGNKLSSLGAYVAPRVPQRLRRFFRWPSFLKFKLRYNKNYKSLRDEIYRQMLYLASHIRVGVQHVRFWLGRDRHLLGWTQFADWARHEYRQLLHNKQAERSAADADPTVVSRMEPSFKAQLEALRAQGKTVQGVDLGKILAAAEQQNKSKKFHKPDEHQHDEAAKRLRRAKRDAGDHQEEDDDDVYEDAEDDELAEEEGEDDGYEQLTPITVDEDEDDTDAEQLFEEFANTQFGDLDELSSVLDSALPASEQHNPTTIDEVDDDDIPEEVGDDFVPVDLRQTGCIIRPENQENCGACYAFAINAAAAYYNCMDRRRQGAAPNAILARYHPHYTSQCGRYMFKPNEYPSINGCQGGRLSRAYTFAQMVGVQRFNDYTFARLSVSGQVGPDECAYPRPDGALDLNFSERSHEVAMFSNSAFTNMKLNEIDLHLRTVGPVFVNIRTWKDFGLMRAGIYGGVEEENVHEPSIHSMLIVGHGRDFFNRDYWIIWNSHGVNWAERGFVRLYTRSLKHFVLFLGGLRPKA